MSRTRVVSALVAGAVIVAGAGAPVAHAVGGTVPEGAAAAVTVKLDIAGDPGAAPGTPRERSCSGALIAPSWVISAASCFAETPGAAVSAGAPTWPTEATVGRADLTGQAGKEVAVDRVVPHPERDVVLVHLAERVTGVTPVKLATTAPAVGDRLTVTGYGRTADQIVPDTVHAATYTVGWVSPRTLDIAAGEPDAAICKGDAGGPALRATSSGVELVAIHHTAFQGGCLGSTSPKRDAVEYRVDDLGSWIVKNTQNAQGADVDGNGKADVFWSRTADGLWRVSYGATTTWNVINGAGAIPTDRFFFGDFDADGRDDVFLAPGDGRWLVSDGGTAGWRVLNSGVPGDHLAFVDLAGDGRTDVFRVDPATGSWSVSDDGEQPLRRINGAPGFGTDTLRFGDFDGDAKDDVFLAPGDGRWLVSWGGTAGWSVLNSGSLPSNHLAVADMTGDGKADVFWVDPSTGNWHISTSGSQPLRHVNGAPGIGGASYQLADITGDGKADVFLPNSDGRWLVSDAGTVGWRHVGGDPGMLPDRPKVR